ncbi:MAG: hypothetical protein RPT25_04525 [Cycloclasticus sp.]|jgi:hypothetical protein
MAKKIALFLLISITYFDAYAGSWYGFLTLGQHPFESCSIKTIRDLNETHWYTLTSAKDVSAQYEGRLENLKKQLISHGFNGVLGFQVDWFGGPGKDSRLSGGFNINGMAYKLACK